MPKPYSSFRYRGEFAQRLPPHPSRAGQEAGRYKGTRSWSRLLRHHALSVSGALWRGRDGRAAQDLLHKKRGFSQKPRGSRTRRPARPSNASDARRSREPSSIRTIPSALDFHQILLVKDPVGPRQARGLLPVDQASPPVGNCTSPPPASCAGAAGRGLTLPRRSFYEILGF